MAKPLANAGADIFKAHAGLTFASTALTGSGTPIAPAVSIASYAWEILSKPSGSTASIDFPATQNPNLLDIDVYGNYVLALVVTDNLAEDSETDRLKMPPAARMVVHVNGPLPSALEKPGDGQRAYLDAYHAAIDELNALRVALTHTIASHSDTGATGAELETLTDGSDAAGLHTHLGADIAVASPIIRGVVLLGESAADPANPKVPTEGRHTMNGFDPSTVALPVPVGNESSAFMAWTVVDAVTIKKATLTMLNGGTGATKHEIELYDMTPTQWLNDDLAGATLFHTFDTTNTSSGQPRTITSIFTRAIGAGGRIIAAVHKTIPATPGHGVEITIDARRLF